MKRHIQVDMSPDAVAQRLREVAQLWKLGMRMKDVRWLGPAREVRGPGRRDTSLEVHHVDAREK